jgi:hypothetical protein
MLPDNTYLDIIIEYTIDISVPLEQLESPFVTEILKLPQYKMLESSYVLHIRQLQDVRKQLIHHLFAQGKESRTGLCRFKGEQTEFVHGIVDRCELFLKTFLLGTFTWAIT